MAVGGGGGGGGEKVLTKNAITKTIQDSLFM
jgi:hypothetical protein